MTYLKNQPLLLLLTASLLFGVLKALWDALVGFSYGDSSAVARVAHDVAMMLWGGVLVSLHTWTNRRDAAAAT